MKQFLVAVDQVANTMVGWVTGDGWADETLSAKAYRLRDKGWGTAYIVINKLFLFQDDHCKSAFLSELKRSHLPIEYRE